MKLLTSILLRQARLANQADPRSWLEDLQTTKWTDVNAQNGQIIGTALNGKSVNLQALPGTTIFDLMAATELALQTLEAGFIAPPTETRVNLR